MGGGNGQKAKMAREKNLEKSKASKGSQLETNEKAMSIQLELCLQRTDYRHSHTIIPHYTFTEYFELCFIHSFFEMSLNNGTFCVIERSFLSISVFDDVFSFYLNLDPQCKVCMQTFMCTTTEVKCQEHAAAKHPKSDLYACFPHLKK